MKKLLALLLVMVMVFALVACGGDGGTDPEKDKETEPVTNSEPPADPGDDDEDDNSGDDAEMSNLEKSLALDLSGVMSSDNKPLVGELAFKPFPERPEDPEALGEDEAGRYYDMEFAGWDTVKSPSLPESPADGCIGKKIIVIVHGDHPWTTAYSKGVEMVCEAYGMEVEIMSPNWEVTAQNQQIEQAINAQPDAIALIPINAESALQQFKKITDAGIPAFGSNLLTTSDAMSYMISWTGPDDWAQMRELARLMADDLGGEGGVCYLTHNPGGSAYFARMFGPRTELNDYAPDVKMLDFQSPGFEAPACKQVVSDWITRFGDELTAIFCADDSAQVTGAVDACKEAGREDIKIYAAGNSKIGQDLIKAGDITAINYQSAEHDGAAVVQTIAQWFNGQDVPEMGYLVPEMINADNVDSYYPCQW